jgi:hypothetical protein
VLIPAENEHQERDQDPAAGNSQEAGRDAADAASQKSAENVGLDSSAITGFGLGGCG